MILNFNNVEFSTPKSEMIEKLNITKHVPFPGSSYLLYCHIFFWDNLPNKTKIDYTPVTKHSYGKSTILMVFTKKNDGFSMAMLA